MAVDPQTLPTGRTGRGRQPEEGPGHTHTPLDDPLCHQPRAHTPLTTHTQPQQCIFSVATGACSLCKFSRQSGELCTAVAALPITVGPSCLSPRTRSPVSVAVAPNTPPGSEAGVSGPCPGPRDTVQKSSERGCHSRTTVPPTASKAALIFSASALATFALISWGRDSTSFLA